METRFEELALVSHLKNKNLDFYTSVQKLYIFCKDMLEEIPNCFPNYTLHDIDHSIRVIGYMADMVKNTLQDFSCLHIMLMIAVGLLHDTGMVVSAQEAENFYTKFRSGNHKFQSFTEEKKKKYFQDYIRKHHGERVINVLKSQINKDTKISSLLYVGDTQSYDLTELVAKICRSHTESCDWISRNLSSKEVYGDYEINPQHIAFLLRIADALDIDDRRAPFFLYKLLNPTGRGDIEWQKHIPIHNYSKISWDCDNKMCKVTLTGECTNQQVFREIMGYIQNLQCDLQAAIKLCSNFPDIYKLYLCETITSAIVTKGFEASTLRFTLDYQQISTLLMGEKIYGSKKDGLRELIQNAIDAVLLMKDIYSNNPYSNYSPLVGIEIDEDQQKFVVFDNGTGMSQSILDNFFFNIGSSFYTSDEFVLGEYSYEPIGHFGIGFLACFMLSSSITIKTKHYSESKTYEMSFDRNSPYVTKKESEQPFPEGHGTHIILDYAQIIPDIFENITSIREYLQELLVYGGYKLVIHNKVRNEVPLTICENGSSHSDDPIAISFNHDDFFNVKFNMLELFKDNDRVYIVDSDETSGEDMICCDDFIALSTIEEMVKEVEHKIQLGSLSVNEALFELPKLFTSWIIHNVKNYKTIVLNGEIHSLLERYLNSFVKNDRLEWYEFPVVYSNSQLLNLIKAAEQRGIFDALEFFKDKVKRLRIISNKQLTKEQILAVICDHIILETEIAADQPRLEYYDEYPLPSILGWYELLSVPGTNNYLCIASDYHLPASRVYLKGIYVKKEKICLPYAISGVGISDVYVNILSGDYCTDVAREKLDDVSKNRLTSNVARTIYRKFIEKVHLNEKEVKLVELFLEKYYPEGT